MEEGKEMVKNQETLPEIQSEDTVKIRPPTPTVQSRMEELIPFAGTIETTEEQRKILFAPVKEEDVEIRPDGLVYLPWPQYVERLRDVFGVGWAIIPKDMPKLQQNHMYWPFYLMIQGKLAGFAIGEQEYQPNNRNMSYSDASEGAKSNALMRLCKGIGISLELWKPSFIRAWKAKYAEEYEDQGKKKWRRKDRKVEEAQVVEDVSSEGNDQPPPASSTYEDYYKRMSEIKNAYELKAWWEKHQVEMKKDLPKEQFAEIVAYKDFLKNKFAEEKK
jgi:hypothetical protein